LSRIGLLGSKGTTLDFLHNFSMATGHEITHVIVLPGEHKAAAKVAFHSADKIVAAAGDRYVHQARTYNLSAPEDYAFFEEASLDILFVLGWERLVPDAVLRTLRCGAYGMHGSSYGLPRGRGRSPMNWAILQGHSHFTTSLFRYTPGIDDGDVVASQTFTIFPDDDIASLHTKNRVSMLRLVRFFLPSILAGTLIHQPQSGETPTYYPKRTPDDGVIDWFRTSQEIVRLVRAVAPPYPAAFTHRGSQIVRIDACREFERSMFSSNIRPGEVLDFSPSTGNIIVKTGDGSLLITDWRSDTHFAPEVGAKLESVGHRWTRAELQARYNEIPHDEWEIREDLSP